MHVVLANMFTWLANGENLLTMLKVIVGVGSLIFVHELGHFLVAKACGVKCEKFYLGFDIAGLKLFKFQWGETEYGIGILPLGGYVKMLGQDDNPANAAEEAERAQAKNDTGTATGLGPRSYTAQTVPERMAIISAGVIMNLIFAVILGAWAYGLGVVESPAALSGTSPGRAGWKAGLRPDDQILQIGKSADDKDDPDLIYDDLLQAVIGSSEGEGIPIKIRRAGETSPIWVELYPDVMKGAGRPQIGVINLQSTKLDDERPVGKNSIAEKTGKFKGGDRIIQINDVPVATHGEIVAQLAKHVDDDITFTVARGDEKLPIELPKNPLKRTGLLMRYGTISAVEDNSPAKKAGLSAGDFISHIDGLPVASTPELMDPLTLADVLRRRAASKDAKVKLTVEHTSETGPRRSEEHEVTLREPTWYEYASEPGVGASVPALGITFRVLNRIQAIESGSPAHKLSEGERLQENDEIIEAMVLPPEKADEETRSAVDTDAMKIDEEHPYWPFMHYAMQYLPVGAKVQFTVKRGEKTWKVVLEPDASANFNWPTRGLNFEPVKNTRTATSFAEAFQLSIRRVTRSAKSTYFFVKNLFTGRVSMQLTGGFGLISVAAGRSAEAGFAELLIFLVMLSVNLAVINSLPIPVLDGGHMVFLLYELIRRKPPSVRVQNVLTLMGFAFILGLILYTNGLDITRLIKWLRS